MSTPSTSSVTGAISNLATGSKNQLSTVNFDTFLTLLVAQLKNQDPLNPLEGTEFTGQIAQFSQLEQQINSNGYLSKLLEQRDFGQQTLGASYLSKHVLVPGDKIEKTGSGDVEFGYSVEKGARNVEVAIFKQDGTPVKTFAADASEGRHLVTWDGKNDKGETLPAGSYKVVVAAFDADGKKVPAGAFSYGAVDSVLLEDGNAVLSLLDGRQVALDDVMAVQNPKNN